MSDYTTKTTVAGGVWINRSLPTKKSISPLVCDRMNHMKILAINKRAGLDYDLRDRYEAGMVLSGQEVKSVKTGHVSIKGSFVTLKGGELYLTNATIPPYPHAGELPDYDPMHPRKLLLKKSEIRALIGKSKMEGLTLIPLRIYTKNRYCKLEFGVGKGRKKYDKRSVIAQREAQRRMQREIKT